MYFIYLLSKVRIPDRSKYPFNNYSIYKYISLYNILFKNVIPCQDGIKPLSKIYCPLDPPLMQH